MSEENKVTEDDELAELLGSDAPAAAPLSVLPPEGFEPMEIADKSGRPAFMPVAGATELDVPADVVFVAYGFTAPKLPASDDFALLATNERGYLILDENRMTNFPGVFAGGSIARGPVPLVQVVCDARKATAAIDRFLCAAR